MLEWVLRCAWLRSLLKSISAQFWMPDRAGDGRADRRGRARKGRQSSHQQDSLIRELPVQVAIRFRQRPPVGGFSPDPMRTADFGSFPGERCSPEPRRRPEILPTMTCLLSRKRPAALPQASAGGDCDRPTSGSPGNHRRNGQPLSRGSILSRKDSTSCSPRCTRPAPYQSS